MEVYVASMAVCLSAFLGGYSLSNNSHTTIIGDLKELRKTVDYMKEELFLIKGILKKGD